MSYYQNLPQVDVLHMNLPHDWSKVVFLVGVPLLVLIFALHAWYSRHVRIHGFPPVFFLRWARWLK